MQNSSWSIRTTLLRAIAFLVGVALVGVGATVPAAAAPAGPAPAATAATPVLEVPQVPGGRIHVLGAPGTPAEAAPAPPLPDGVDYVQVAAGAGQAMALRSDGEAVSWAVGGASVLTVPSLPEGLDYVKIARDTGSVLFLRSDGSIVGTGDNSSGQLDVPAPPPGTWYTDVALGSLSAAALRSDGQVVVWGHPDYARVPALPDGLRYTSLGGGAYTFLAVRSDGRVIGWGVGACGLLDLPVDGAPYVALAAAVEQAAGIRADGSLVVRRCEPSGEIPGPDLAEDEIPVALALQFRHSVVVTSAGSAVSWGPSPLTFKLPRLAPDGRPYVAVSLSEHVFAGIDFALALTADGPATLPVPTPPTDGRPVDSSGVVVWGSLPDGELPQPLGAGRRYRDVSVGEWHVALLDSEDDPSGYGDDTGWATTFRHNESAQMVEAGAGYTVWLGSVHEPDVYMSKPWASVYGGRVAIGGGRYDRTTDLDTGLGYTVITSSPGPSRTGDAHSYGILTGDPAVDWIVDPPAGIDTVDVAVGATHAVRVLSDGTLGTWGEVGGALGVVPRAPAGTRFSAVAAGAGFSVALLDDGTLRSWGRTDNGLSAPPAPPAGERYVAIDAGRDHALALASDGTVHAWGSNEAGQTEVPPAPEGTRYGVVSAGGTMSAAVVAPATTLDVTIPAVWPSGRSLPVRVAAQNPLGVPGGTVGVLVDGVPVATTTLEDGVATLRVDPGDATSGQRRVEVVHLGADGLPPARWSGEVAVGAAPASPGAGSPASSTDRLAGTDRYSTAVASTRGIAPGIPVLFVASGENFPDALSAAPAAAHAGGALLLTRRDALPAVVEAEIRRLNPTSIVVVGGEPSVSGAVFAQLAWLAPSVSRIAGSDRYATSRLIATYSFGTHVGAAILADGRRFPDALAAGAPAGATGIPVILVPGGTTTASAELGTVLRTLGVHDVIVAGGAPSVSAGLEASVAALPFVRDVERVAGADRYETSRLVSSAVFGDLLAAGVWEPSDAYLATGRNFPDALVGAAVAGLREQPLFVVPSSCVPDAVRADLDVLAEGPVHLLGGSPSLGEGVARLESC